MAHTGWPMFAQTTKNGAASQPESPSIPVPIASPPSPLKVSPRLRLDNGPMVRREIVKLYRGMKAGEIDIVKGAKLVWTLEVLGRMIERETVEKLAERLDAVEAHGVGR